MIDCAEEPNGCFRAGGHVQHYAGHLSEELLREHEGGHPAAAVPEQGQYI